MIANGIKNDFSLCAFWLLGLADALFKFPESSFKNEQQIIYIRPGIVPALMPSTRAMFKSFVIAIPIVFNKPVETYLAPDFQSELVALKEQQKSGNPSIAVAKRMDAEKIQVESCHQYQRRYSTMADGGDIPALLALAGRYDNGEGVTKDESKATEIYEKAAM